MNIPVSIVLSSLALGVSAGTAWLTLIHRGIVKMTQPTIICFGFDIRRSVRERAIPKIYLRTLLFATSKRGRVVENMYVSLTHNKSKRNFSFWVHGDSKLYRGSGILVDDKGVSTNHHFMVPHSEAEFVFTAGKYQLDVFAQLHGDRTPTLLFSQSLELYENAANSLAAPEAGVFFNWEPDSMTYLQHAEVRPSSRDINEFMTELVGLGNDAINESDG